MKTTIKSMKENYARLKDIAKGYATSVIERKSIRAYSYKATSGAGAELKEIKQFNVVAVPELINHVLTAAKLGYETQLLAEGGELIIKFVDKIPSTPIEIMY